MKKKSRKKTWARWAFVIVCLIAAIVATRWLPEVWNSDVSRLCKNEMLFGTMGLWGIVWVSIGVALPAKGDDS